MDLQCERLFQIMNALYIDIEAYLYTMRGYHSKSRIIKSSKKLLVLMSSGKRGGNLFYISKQYYENLKQVRKSLKPAQSV